MCNGEFFNKEPEEAFEYFDYLAKNAQSWDTADAYDRSKCVEPSSGKFNLSADDDLRAKLTLLSRKVDAIELKKVNEVQVIPRVPKKCGIGHLTNECPSIPAFKEVLLDQSNVVNLISKSFAGPYSNTYNPGWRNHPNFGWRNDQSATSVPAIPEPQQYAPQPAPTQKRGLEEIVQLMANTLQQFMQGQATINNQNSHAINEMRSTLTNLTTTLSIQKKGKFPAQPKPNPQAQAQQVQAASDCSNLKPVKVITTLRSGKVVNIPAQGADEVKSSGKDFKLTQNVDDENSTKVEVCPCPISAPFPQRLVPLHKNKHHVDILEIFKQVNINIPLLNVIQQIPIYAKFLKDLCPVKRKLNVQKKAFLIEQVSAIIQRNTPPKYKDLGSPTIACVIGSSKIGQTLLDRSSSVNLLPYTIYEQLGLGELKPTPIILQLVDRSIKMPIGIVEDVLVQIDKFFYPVDFVVLDVHLTSPSSFQAPIILGRPFFATSNALINCISGILKLSFGNMTLELNIFNTCRQPHDLEEIHEVNLLEAILD